jgi:hypothetical protein
MKYPDCSDIPIEIHEFAVLTDENGRRLYNGDVSEWGASWMADIADRVYKLNVADIFQWATTTYGIANPRTHILALLEEMESGELIKVESSQPDDQERIGCLAVKKNDGYDLMIYRHRPEREELGVKELKVKIEGEDFIQGNWKVTEAKIIDHQHSGYIRTLYQDIEEAGIESLEDSPYFGGQMERRYGKKGREIFEKNREKYKEIGELAEIEQANKLVESSDECLYINADMASHSVLFIRLDK